MASIGRAWGQGTRSTSGHVELDVRGPLVAEVRRAGKGVSSHMGRGHAERLLVWGIGRRSVSRCGTGSKAWCSAVVVVVVSGREEEGRILGVGGLGLVVEGVCVRVVLDVDVLHRVIRWGLARRVARHDGLFTFSLFVSRCVNEGGM